MDLQDALLQEHSKNQTDKIISWIGGNKARVAELMTLFAQGQYRVVQRAAWVLSGVASKHPELMQQYLSLLVKMLQDPKAHVAVKRNVYRMFQFVELPESIHSDLMNSSFEALADPKEARAVRVFAMAVLARLALVYPELNNELKVIVEDALQQEQAPSFKSRGKKVLQQIKQNIT